MTHLEFALIANQLDQLALTTKNTRDELNLTLKHIEHLKSSLTKACKSQVKTELKPQVLTHLPSTDKEPSHLVRLKEVVLIIGVSRSTIYKLINQGDFPQSTKLGVRTVTWLRSDIMNWIKVKTNAN
jgi:prophage regulatory protein